MATISPLNFQKHHNCRFRFHTNKKSLVSTPTRLLGGGEEGWGYLMVSVSFIFLPSFLRAVSDFCSSYVRCGLTYVSILFSSMFGCMFSIYVRVRLELLSL